MRKQRSPTRRFYLAARRKLRAGGRIAMTGLLTGLGAYSGLRVASPLFRAASRSRLFRRVAPSFAASTRRLARKGAAAEWGMATGTLASVGKTWGETKTAARRKYKRWLSGK